jgi:hypothetical protein
MKDSFVFRSDKISHEIVSLVIYGLEMQASNQTTLDFILCHCLLCCNSKKLLNFQFLSLSSRDGVATDYNH